VVCLYVGHGLSPANTPELMKTEQSTEPCNRRRGWSLAPHGEYNVLTCAAAAMLPVATITVATRCVFLSPANICAARAALSTLLARWRHSVDIFACNWVDKW